MDLPTDNLSHRSNTFKNLTTNAVRFLKYV